MGKNDGRHDFDFLFGAWQIANRKRVTPLVPGDHEWIEFDAVSEARPILAGLANADTYSAPGFPGRPGFQGFTLRLFEPKTGLWRIWWASSAGSSATTSSKASTCGSGTSGRSSRTIRSGGSRRSRSTAAAPGIRTG